MADAEQADVLPSEIIDRPVEPNDTRFTTGIVLLKAAALLCGAWLLMDDHPAAAVVCLCGGIGLAGFLALGLIRRRQ
jgi:MYXO-CTERM domain-containing protein